MAEIVWHDNALEELDAHLEYALMEFGETTLRRWQREIKAFEERVKVHPKSYSPEQFLLGSPVLFRRCHLMQRRFKLIHYYAENEDTVHVVDIWDTRMSPEALIVRINQG